MTAEIAILNKSGIALAADSAVTIGGNKVYNSANKLFMLSKYYPVGIMVYNSADFMGVPWETLIKEYRHQIGKKSFNTLKEYDESFWDFITKTPNLIPTQNKDNYIAGQVHTYIDIVLSKLETFAQKDKEQKIEISFERAIKNLKLIISLDVETISKIQTLNGFSEDDIANIIENKKDIFVAIIEARIPKLYKKLDTISQNTLLEIISNLFIKEIFNMPHSGVVIAGYGNSEIYPKIASHIVEGIITSKLKKVIQIDKSNVHIDGFYTFIVPFAQDEMVQTFFNGIDPGVQQFSENYLNEIFKKLPGTIDNDKLGLSDEKFKELKKSLHIDFNTLFNDFRKNLSEYQRNNNSQPILDMVGVLPKDELAAMAESLVNLTVFKRKITTSVETVGGPIDVAVISKGDGFIWVKRKHYFEPELNQHFFANYYRGKAHDC